MASEGIVWSINGKVIATIKCKKGVKSILKSTYHDVGPFCNLFVTSLQLFLFCFNARICLFTCVCYFKWTVYSLSFTSYHFKLTMLLSKGKEVTKVPYFSYRERERTRGSVYVTIKCGSSGEFQMLTLFFKSQGVFVQLFCAGQERMQKRSNKTVLKGEPWNTHSEDKESFLQSNLHWLIDSFDFTLLYLGTEKFTELNYSWLP